MITRDELEQAIYECQAERDPNSQTCIKLAAFLTIREIMFSEQEPQRYSYSPPPTDDVSRETEPDSEFLQLIRKMNTSDAWALMDELMDTLKVINRRLYDGVMRRIKP